MECLDGLIFAIFTNVSEFKANGFLESVLSLHRFKGPFLGDAWHKWVGLYVKDLA